MFRMCFSAFGHNVFCVYNIKLIGIIYIKIYHLYCCHIYLHDDNDDDDDDDDENCMASNMILSSLS